MKGILTGFFLALFLIGCSPRSSIQKKLQAEEVRLKDHIGFMVYDPLERKTLVEFNSGKYFTPASNTKVFTLYTSLQVLGDSLPGLKYVISGDSLYFKGTGDPSFLYSEVSPKTSRVLDFLNKAPSALVFSTTNFDSEHFGPGWAWDDYPYYFSVEKSSMPIYGNLIEIHRPGSQWIVNPAYFSHGIVLGDSSAKTTNIARDENANRFVVHPGKRDDVRSWSIPFRTSPQDFAGLLSDTLHRGVQWTQRRLKGDMKTIYSVPSDSVYKVMMQQSDNFIAEQLLLVCAGILTDTLKTEIAINYALKKFLFDLPDAPTWVDGSGLSRYNLITPRTMVRIWDKIYTKVPRERLFKLLPAGGQSGTLKNSYKSAKPYLYGKTGSLSNNHCLSGFLITKKNRVLIFSFMNSNFVDPSSEIRSMMEKILVQIRDTN